MKNLALGEKGSRCYRAALFLLLIAVGLLGNYFKLPIFLNIDFLFGSIFALLALQYFGLGRGSVAAALIASVTYVLWNHPYAIVIMTAEVAVVGGLMRRYKIGLVLADVIYWLCAGMALVFVFYHLVMGVSTGNTAIIITKQAVNGIANALAARLIFSGVGLWSGKSHVTLRELIYNLLAFFTLVPALILLVLASRAEFAETDLSIRTTLHQKGLEMSGRLELWVKNRTNTIVSLAGLAGTLTPAQMQDRLDQARASDVNFQRIGLRNTESLIVAYSPAIDEFGKPNIGKQFPERPYIARLKQTGKPMLAEVVMGRIDTPKPTAILLAPVMMHGDYGGYVNGVLNLEQLRDYLEKAAERSAMFYSLLDRAGNIILTNRQGQAPLTPLVRGPGSLTRMAEGVAQWIPEQPANISIAERWKNSFYVAEVPIGDLAEWTLVLEQPIAPFQKVLHTRYTDALGLLLVILLVALALAEFLSRKSLVALESLSQLTRDLPAKLASIDHHVDWPKTSIVETHRLVSNFKAMASSLVGQLDEVRRINESLDQRVTERTSELKESEQRYHSLFNDGPLPMWVFAEESLKFLAVNDQAVKHYGYSLEEFKAMTMRDIRPQDQVAELSRILLASPDGFMTGESVHQKKDGTVINVAFSMSPLKFGGVPARIAHIQDITERKKLEQQILELAFHDPLTKLPNRRLLKDRLGQRIAAAKRTGGYGALMFIDLDNFKPLNDRHGHEVGDLLLIEAANRLSACVRETDTVARFGGDEFVVMIAELDADKTVSIEQVTHIAEKIRTALSARYVLSCSRELVDGSAIEHVCTASIGVALFGQANVHQDDIVKWADTAMYQAKQAGRNVIRFSDAAAAAI